MDVITTRELKERLDSLQGQEVTREFDTCEKSQTRKALKSLYFFVKFSEF